MVPLSLHMELPLFSSHGQAHSYSSSLLLFSHFFIFFVFVFLPSLLHLFLSYSHLLCPSSTDCLLFPSHLPLLQQLPALGYQLLFLILTHGFHSTSGHHSLALFFWILLSVHSKSTRRFICNLLCQLPHLDFKVFNCRFCPLMVGH